MPFLSLQSFMPLKDLFVPETPIIFMALRSMIGRIEWQKIGHLKVQDATRKAETCYMNQMTTPLSIKNENERRFERALLQMEELTKRMNDPTHVDLPERVVALEDEVALLREQVKFLEDLVVSRMPYHFDHQLPTYGSTAISMPSTPLTIPYSELPGGHQRMSVNTTVTDLELDTLYSIGADSLQAYSHERKPLDIPHYSETDVDMTTRPVPWFELELLPFIQGSKPCDCPSNSVASDCCTASSYIVGGSTCDTCSSSSAPASPSASSDCEETGEIYLFDREFMLDKEPSVPILTTSAVSKLPARGSALRLVTVGLAGMSLE